MTPQEIKQQAHKEFDKKFVKDSTMTNVRLIERQNPNEIKSFLDSLIDRTVQMTEERIVNKLKNKQKSLKKEIKKYKTLPFYREAGEVRGEFIMVSELISLITNKSEINK